MTARRPTLHVQILYWLAGYGLLLTVAVLVHGFLVNEYAERLIWDSLLHNELDHHLEHQSSDPEHRWRDSKHLKLYTSSTRLPPPGLHDLPVGIHDELLLGAREVLALIAERHGERYTMVLDITEFESQEDRITLMMVGFALLLVLLMGALGAFGLRRALQPLNVLADDIRALEPDRSGQRIALGERASSELLVIANAMNDYQRRTEFFLERERIFIDTASHELRTPIAVITGASELALDQADLPPAARLQIQRTLRTARNVEQLITLLLTLTKDPSRLARSSGPVHLHELLPEVVNDHRHLLQGKSLDILIDCLEPSIVEAPLHIVQAAIGNLLRNAIEHSDRGEIHVRLEAEAIITIVDPGHGMTPEEVSRLYAQMARGGGDARAGGGIGLNLLARLCEHLNWGLSIQSTPGSGTVSQLRLASQLRSAPP
jgi:signal transduction histidine kinase